MKNVLSFWSAFTILTIVLVFSSCKKDEGDPTPAQLLQGTWRCETESGYYDELIFKSTTDVTWLWYDATDGSVETFDCSFEATPSSLILTYKEDKSTDTFPYSLAEDKLTVTMDNKQYLYKKQK